MPERSRMQSKLPWFVLSALCVTADLWSKHAVFYPHVLEPGFHEGLAVGEVTSWWRIIIVYNEGITFGMLPEAGPWILAVGTTAVIGFLGWKLWTVDAGRRLHSFALAIVIGGALGNLYDRTLRPWLEPDKRPGVRDFLDWYASADTALGKWLLETVGENHWYTSNVADVLIVCGVILLAWCILREPSPRDDTSPSAEAAA